MNDASVDDYHSCYVWLAKDGQGSDYMSVVDVVPSGIAFYM